MRVLGIDCGGEYTGYGVVEMHAGGRLVCLTCGAIKLSPREPLARRLSRIYDDDLEQLEAGMLLYDAFYRWCRDASGETHNWPTNKAKP